MIDSIAQNKTYKGIRLKMKHSFKTTIEISIKKQPTSQLGFFHKEDLQLALTATPKLETRLNHFRKANCWRK